MFARQMLSADLIAEAESGESGAARSTARSAHMRQFHYAERAMPVASVTRRRGYARRARVMRIWLQSRRCHTFIDYDDAPF